MVTRLVTVTIPVLIRVSIGSVGSSLRTVIFVAMVMGLTVGIAMVVVTEVISICCMGPPLRIFGHLLEVHHQPWHMFHPGG